MKNTEAGESKEAAQHYSNIANILAPGRKEILSIIAKLATEFVSEYPKVLDKRWETNFWHE